MATKSLQELYRCLAKVESSNNTDPTTTTSADSVLLAEPPDWAYDFRFAPTNVPIARTLTHQHKDILQSASMSVRLRGILNGNGTAGDNTTASFKGQDAIFRAAAMTSTAVALTDVEYTPSTLATLERVWLDLERDGETQEVGGCVGNLVITGTAQERVTWEFSGIGHYRANALGTLASSYALTDRSEVFTSVTGGIKPGAGATYDSTAGLVLAGFTFNRGITTQTCIDALSTYGIKEFFVGTKPRPTLSVTIVKDTATANLDVGDLPDDITGRTDHGVEFMYGTAPNEFRFAFPTAQLLNFTRGYTNGYETLTLNYFIRHSTAESEFAINLGDGTLAIAT